MMLTYPLPLPLSLHAKMVCYRVVGKQGVSTEKRCLTPKRASQLQWCSGTLDYSITHQWTEEQLCLLCTCHGQRTYGIRLGITKDIAFKPEVILSISYAYLRSFYLLQYINNIHLYSAPIHKCSIYSISSVPYELVN